MNAVDVSRKCLAKFLDNHEKDRTVDREQVVAFAMLTALRGHFPSRCLAMDDELLELCKIIAEVEPDRFFKQRRIAIANLVEEFRD